MSSSRACSSLFCVVLMTLSTRGDHSAQSERMDRCYRASLRRGVLPGGTSDFNRALAVENLAAVWANFERAGVRRLVLARVIQSADDLDLFAQAIPDCDLAVCRVTAPRSTIVDRIRRREAGSAASFLERVSRELDDEVARLDLPGFVVENGDARSISDLALEVLERIDWPRPLRRPDDSHLVKGSRRALSPRPRRPTPGTRPCGACP